MCRGRFENFANSGAITEVNAGDGNRRSSRKTGSACLPFAVMSHPCCFSSWNRRLNSPQRWTTLFFDRARVIFEYSSARM